MSKFPILVAGNLIQIFHFDFCSPLESQEGWPMYHRAAKQTVGLLCLQTHPCRLIHPVFQGWKPRPERRAP